MSKARGYLAKAKQCEARAKKVRNLESQEWHTVLRGLSMLAVAESEVVARRLSVAA